jgi:enoyl-CoA hydratase
MIDPVADPSPSHPPTLNIDGSRAVVRLNRPRYHNRVEADDIAALCEIFGRIERDNSVRVLILSARGRTFCSGFNLEDLAPGASQGSAPAFAHMADQLETLRVPSVCAVNGACMAGVPISRSLATSGSVCLVPS